MLSNVSVFCLHLHRLPSRISFGSTSTPMSAPSTRPSLSPQHTTQSRDWLTTLETLAYTPPGSSYSGSSRVLPALVLDNTETTTVVTTTVATTTATTTTATPGFSPIMNLTNTSWSRLNQNSPPHTPCSTRSLSRSLSRSRSLLPCAEDDWGAGDESFNKRSFEPKNLLTMFEEAV